MRRETDLCKGWEFFSNCSYNEIDTRQAQPVDLPHTWNAIDGQDGGNDYFRGKGCYRKSFARPEIREDKQLYLEFDGVNSISDVFFNGKAIAHHEGGYSTFRVRIDALLEDMNTLVVVADNGVGIVYPQAADFTFYGGIYRPVRLVELSQSHFAYGKFGGKGVRLTPSVKADGSGSLQVQSWIEGPFEDVVFSLYERETCVAQAKGQNCTLEVPEVHLWNGVEDPFLYRVEAQLVNKDVVCDSLEYNIGFRTFTFDAQKGFFLNGKSYPLRGVSRHQDRIGVGNALTEQMHSQDMDLILEVGANSIRLAHYQHSQFFYDLCDKKGIICWAEIPYITKHMPEGRANTISQLRELIEQNYNHTSIACWGISNEISAGGNSDDLYDNNCTLRDLAHSMDSTRVVSMAHAFMLPVDDRVVSLPDIAGYNLYYGWYLGEMDGNGPFLDLCHETHPDLPLGLTEFGCDANPAFQNNSPVKGDYSETYQAVFHDFMCSEIDKRPYLWGTYIWNMFDFAADARDEGGTKGRNCKGLVTFDRKLKKDAFYAVKAWYSKQPFVHICGSRYVDRAETETLVRVFSNQDKVELFVNGKSVGCKQGKHSFLFTIPNVGESVIEARSNGLSDSICIRKVEQQNPDYIYSSAAEVENWFAGLELKFPEGYLSVNEKIGDIICIPEGRAIFDEVLAYKSKDGGTDVASQVETTEYMIQVTMKDVVLSEMLRRLRAPEEFILEINRKLNQIRKINGGV